jgi:hypothetical protein
MKMHKFNDREFDL